MKRYRYRYTELEIIAQFVAELSADVVAVRSTAVSLANDAAQADGGYPQDRMRALASAQTRLVARIVSVIRRARRRSDRKAGAT